MALKAMHLVALVLVALDQNSIVLEDQKPGDGLIAQKIVDRFPFCLSEVVADVGRFFGAAKG